MCKVDESMPERQLNCTCTVNSVCCSKTTTVHVYTVVSWRFIPPSEYNICTAGSSSVCGSCDLSTTNHSGKYKTMKQTRHVTKMQAFCFLIPP